MLGMCRMVGLVLLSAIPSFCWFLETMIGVGTMMICDKYGVSAREKTNHFLNLSQEKMPEDVASMFEGDSRTSKGLVVDVSTDTVYVRRSYCERDKVNSTDKKPVYLWNAQAIVAVKCVGFELVDDNDDEKAQFLQYLAFESIVNDLGKHINPLLHVDHTRTFFTCTLDLRAYERPPQSASMSRSEIQAGERARNVDIMTRRMNDLGYSDEDISAILDVAGK